MWHDTDKLLHECFYHNLLIQLYNPTLKKGHSHSLYPDSANIIAISHLFYLQMRCILFCILDMAQTHFCDTFKFLLQSVNQRDICKHCSFALDGLTFWVEVPNTCVLTESTTTRKPNTWQLDISLLWLASWLCTWLTLLINDYNITQGDKMNCVNHWAQTKTYTNSQQYVYELHCYPIQNIK